MKKRVWSFDELEFIKENYDRLTLDELSKILQCSKSTLTYTIKKLLKLGRKPLVRNVKTRKKEGGAIIKIKCKICGKNGEVFANTLSGRINVCGDCVKNFWGSKELLEVINSSSLSYDEKNEIKRMMKK